MRSPPPTAALTGHAPAPQLAPVPQLAPARQSGVLPRRVALQQFGALALCTAVASVPKPLSASMALPPPISRTEWLPLEQFGEAAEAGASLPEPFVVYLARFLLRYDAASASWYADRAQQLPESWRDQRVAAKLEEELSSFAASLKFGLAPLAGKGRKGASELWDSLERAYGGGAGEGEADGARGDGPRAQLPLLFSLLEPAQQPLERIRAALSRRGATGGATGGAAGVAGGAASGAALLSSSPDELLLPSSTVPVWDEGVGAYTLPAPLVEALASRGGMGSIGRAPVSRELFISPEVYRLFALSGGMGCALTHLAVVPLDVVKTRLQTRPGVYAGFADAVTAIRREEGLPMLFQGAGATGAGYFAYGVCVYPLYEIFKRWFFGLAGETLVLEARVPLVLAAGAVATFFTCFAISPFETIRIRMVEDPTYAPDLVSASRRFVSEGGVASLYDGIIPLLVRQILFGMVKFLIFDTAADAITAALPPDLAEAAFVSLGVSLLSGAIAGVAAAIVSQPADVVLSRVAQGGEAALEGQLPGDINQFALIVQQAKAVNRLFGVKGFFLGLPSRCLWSGAIIAGQFFLYDVFKTAFHIAATDLTQFYDALGASAVEPLVDIWSR